MENDGVFMEEAILGGTDSLMEDDVVEEGILVEEEEDDGIVGDDNMIEDDMYAEDDDGNDPDYEENPNRNLKTENRDEENNPCTICQRSFKTPAVCVLFYIIKSILFKYELVKFIF